MELKSKTISLMPHQAWRSGRMFILMLAFACLPGACSEHDRADIRAVLDARDAAVSKHDTKAYAALLMPGYSDHDQTEFEIINRMRRLFEQFEQIEMRSDNRTLRLLDHRHAECEQSYLLHVQANGLWRKLNQRERISLTKTEIGWKISGGL